MLEEHIQITNYTMTQLFQRFDISCSSQEIWGHLLNASPPLRPYQVIIKGQ